MKYLIIGLGNIGAEYEGTRHNIGFDVLDYIAEEQGVSFNTERLAFYTHFKHKGRAFHLIKPTTYMNRSGRAVRYWMQELSIDAANILVVVDELALPLGKIRIKGKGSDGGHNGLRDIQDALGHNNYPRLRFGIGDDFPKGFQVDYVLGRWTIDEQQSLGPYVKKAHEAILSFGTIGLERTMNFFN